MITLVRSVLILIYVLFALSFLLPAVALLFGVTPVPFGVFSLLLVAPATLYSILAYGLYRMSWWIYYLNALFIVLLLVFIPFLRIGILSTAWRSKDPVLMGLIVATYVIPILVQLFVRKHRTEIGIPAGKPATPGSVLLTSLTLSVLTPMFLLAAFTCVFFFGGLFHDRTIVTHIFNDRYEVLIYQEGNSTLTDGYTTGAVVDRKTFLKGERELFTERHYLNIEARFVDSVTVEFRFDQTGEKRVFDLVRQVELPALFAPDHT